MSRTYRILIVAVVAIVATGGYWKFVMGPKRVEAADLQVRIVTAEGELAQTQQLIATYKGARDSYERNYATVVRLGKAVPTDDDTRSLLVQLDTSAKRSAVDFDTINLNAAGSGGGAAAAVTTPGAVNAGAFSALPFSFSFSGTFETLGSFFARLENYVALKGDTISVSGRLMRIENLALAPGDGGWPALTAQVGASAYIVPEAAPATAAGTAATTGAAATGASTAAGAPTTQTTTTTSPGTDLR